MCRHLRPLIAACLAMQIVQGTAMAQRHSGGSSPPTAPPLKGRGAAPVVAVSSGMGTLEFIAVNYGVPAPQSLTRQLEADDDRTRGAALSAIGAPGQYLSRGHIPYPHSIHLDFTALGTTDELDAVLTVELDQHLVSAVLFPEDGTWHRIATMLYATSFGDPSTSPGTFLSITRSMLQRDHYRAVYHASAAVPNGDFMENEAQLRIVNGHAVVTISFVSSARSCGPVAGRGGGSAGCELTRRWLQPDPADPTHHFILMTATGHLTAREEALPLAASPPFQLTHLRNLSCQPFVFSEASQHYEPTANSAPCPAAR